MTDLSLSGVSVRARVKWFNVEKGFGFVAPLDGAPDAFLHATALQRSGYPAAQEGAEVVCELAHGPKGMQVVRVLDLSEPAGVPDDEIPGTVKWFAPEKGFGFVVADDGGRDIFVHKSVLRRCGLESLSQGQRLRVRAAVTPKGREAVWVGEEE